MIEGDYYVSKSLLKEIEKEGMDYCGSTDIEVLKNIIFMNVVMMVGQHYYKNI